MHGDPDGSGHDISRDDPLPDDEMPIIDIDGAEQWNNSPAKVDTNLNSLNHHLSLLKQATHITFEPLVDENEQLDGRVTHTNRHPGSFHTELGIVATILEHHHALPNGVESASKVTQGNFQEIIEAARELLKQHNIQPLPKGWQLRYWPRESGNDHKR